MSVLDLIRAAKRPERSVELCLRGDLQSEYERIERRLNQGLMRRADTFDGAGAVTRMEEIRAEMRAATVTARLSSIGLERVANLMAGHPPREKSSRDAQLGFNTRTFYPALIRAACAEIVQGDDTLALHDEDGKPNDAMSAADWGEQAGDDYPASGFLGNLSSRQYQELRDAAWAVDQDEVEVPFSPLAFVNSLLGGESSKRQEPGESAPASGQDAKPAKSRRTSTTKKAASSAQ